MGDCSICPKGMGFDCEVCQLPVDPAAALREGKYKFRAPPVCTAQWDDEAWIKFVNAGRGWTVPVRGSA